MNRADSDMYDFTILILEDSYPTSVSATLDILSAAAAVAPRLRSSVPRWRVCSIRGKRLRLQNGLSIATEKLPLASRTDRSVWVIPGLGVERAEALERRLAQHDAVDAAAAIARHVRRGAQIAASCSAVFLLDCAGVLRGRRVTTSWWLAPLLQRRSSDCVVDADRIVCSDRRVTTAGAAFAQTDLMLHLLRERFGKSLVDAVARVLLIDGRQAQAPFVIPEVLANGDELVARVASRIERSLPEPPSIAQLAKELRMSERTLSRHMHRVTGRSTIALVQSVKVRRARALLESSRMSVEQVAEAVGYQDATALRRVMKRIGGAPPSRFRI